MRSRRGATRSPPSPSIPARGGDDLPFDDLGHGRTDPRTYAKLVRLVRSHDVTIAHGGSSLLPVAASATAARRPFVYRNIGDPSYWGRTGGATVRIGLPLRLAAHVVALYRGSASYMIDRYRLDPDRVTVAPNAVDVERFPARDEAARHAARSELGLDEDRLVLGYLGNLSSEKRPEWALDTVAALDDAVLLVAGDGPLAPALSASAAALGTRDGAPVCRLIGPVTDPAAFLCAIDVLLVPSRTEGVPGVLVEAGLVGVPTVATDVGGVAEVMAATSGGRCVQTDDPAGFIEAVRAVGLDPAGHTPDRDAMIARHSLDQVAGTWEDVLQRVVGEDLST